MECQQDSSSSRGSNRPFSEEQRAIHDIEQANAMRRRKAPQKTTTPSTTKNKSEALSLGLRGLNEADTLRKDGHSQCALDLYQSAIEVLIRMLQDPHFHSATHPKPALEERIRVALSDAEYLKEQLRRGDAQQSASETSSESPMKKTCFTMITQYLASVRNTSSGNKPNIPSQASISTVQAPTRISPSNGSINSTRTNNSANRTTSQQPAISPSMSAKANEALMQNVLTDMYVPSSKLQSTTWNDIAGLATAKQALQEAAIMPLLRPDLFTGLRKPQNILLYGPPGTGKTLLVKAVAYESQSSLFLCSASAATSKWMGDGEKTVRALFLVAQQYSPSIIFIDEIDSILSARKSDGEHEASRRMKTEFMVQIDGISPSNDKGSVLLVACTNCPWDVDSAVLRRFSRRIFVPLPEKEARKALLKGLLNKAGKHSLSKSEISDVVKRLKGFSGSDIQAIATEASFGPLRVVGSLEEIKNVRAKDVRPISIEDFDNAIDQATKSVTKGQLKKYDDWQQQQGA